MAERIISAGVFTKEVDQSFLPAAIGQIGAAIVGPTVKGPALVPTKVSSWAEFTQIFGSYTDDSYVPFTAAEYLRNGNSLTVTTRCTCGNELNVLHPTQAVIGSGSLPSGDYFESTILNNFQSGSFELKISGSFNIQQINGDVPVFTAGNGASISASIVSTSNNYITKIFGRSPKSLDYPVYVQYENRDAISSFNNLGNVSIKVAKISDYSFDQDFKSAATPMITSQKVGSLAKDLFQFYTISAGITTNSEIKVGIRDIRPASEVADPNGYGTFTVEVRRVNTSNIPNLPFSSQDTDQVPEILETFLNVNLDPDSANYISRRIGDRYQTVSNDGVIIVNGDYPNLSKYIRVAVTSGVANKTNEESLIPFGFRAPISPIPMASASTHLTEVSYRTSQVNVTYSPNNYHGFDFTNTNNLNYLAPYPDAASGTQTTGSNSDFYLGDVSQVSQAAFPSSISPYTGTLEAALTAGTLTTNVALSTRKFIVPFQGGFDGTRPNLPKFSGANITSANTFGFDCSGTSKTGTISYGKAFAILSNTDYYDFNMLLIPGILDSKHSVVTEAARNLCTGRQDAFYVMDSNMVNDSIQDVVQQVTTLDNNYTATYWPWVRILNPAKNVPVWVPPSVVVPGALAFNDSVAAPWYAPAGLNRGGLTSVSSTYQNLSQADRNTLYDARVNPIANFPNDGVVIWGQKTLQARPSALDRVNVRRLLIAVKKYIASATRYLIFDQNTVATRTKFTSIVNPYLESVRAQQGLYAFRVVMDDTNNTPDLIDQNILYGQIFLQPTRTAEFIVLDFNIQPTGAAFPGQ